jgi:natural product biosynthesis luciferase-like monooxygenase protein
MTSDGGAVDVFTPESLIDVVRWWAKSQPDKRLYTFLEDGGATEHHLTYAELNRRASAIGTWLTRAGAAGEPVLLLFPPGLDYVSAFYGCLYAGTIAVPAYPPRADASVRRINAISADCRPTIALSTKSIAAELAGRLGEMPALQTTRWHSLDSMDGATGVSEGFWELPNRIDKGTIAALQYTSGSTRTPRGVLLTQGCLLDNLEAIKQAYRHDSLSHGVIWLPPYHDMGLIGGILQACYIGGSVTLMSPSAMLQRPLRWLEAISRTQASTSGGPNFAFELCIQRTTPEQRARLDLSSWRVAFCGAEPIRSRTLERFAEAFDPSGFRETAFIPSYGLAEATLMVTASEACTRPVVITVDRAALQQHRAIEQRSPEAGARAVSYVGCGRPVPGVVLRIVDPVTRRALPDGDVGEIWVSGPSVCPGYWNRPAETLETFGVYTDDGSGPFLRTGDIGFIRSGDLFIVGREKDLIITHGRNVHPHDIELTIETCLDISRPCSVAVFSMSAQDPRRDDGSERLVALVECQTRKQEPSDISAMYGRVRHAIAAEHGVTLSAMALVRRGSVPTTSSGKIQRRACRAAFEAGELTVLGTCDEESMRRDAAPAVAVTGAVDPCEPVTPPRAAPNAPRGSDEIAQWIRAAIAAQLGIASTGVDPQQPLVYLGLDSVRAVQLAGDLSVWLGRPISPTLPYDYPTIAELARHLADERSPGDAPTVITDKESVVDAIAIVGLACRFPGADSPRALWHLVSTGGDAISEVPQSRALLRAFCGAASNGSTLMPPWGGFLEPIEEFDARFFGISRREAERMDPQQRVLLELSWEALEDAGLVPGELAGQAVGVFVGISTNDYGQMQLNDAPQCEPYVGTGSASSIAANRISYTLNLSGPSLAVDTACSSSLVATHLACRSLRAGESRLALVGGVNVILSPAISLSFARAGFLAPDGRCKPFDARADGYVRSEGAGIVVLKPLRDAIADNDRVYAVIRGSAINQDGRSNGLTAPNGVAQEQVILECCRDARVSPGEVQYVEAHGTGTALGDPIEANALGKVLALGRGTRPPCRIGSIKSNLGHLEAAAGIAGLMKVALALHYKQLPPSIHFESPNPHISFDDLPIRVQRSLEPWHAASGRLIAGLSSFGFGGTNAHLLLESHESTDLTAPLEPKRVENPAVLTIAARTQEALRTALAKYRDYFASGQAAPLSDVCYTAAVRRTHFPFRCAVVGGTNLEIVRGLEAAERDLLDRGRARTSSDSGTAPKLVLVFSGQGTQWPGMVDEVLRSEPVFREHLEACAAAVTSHVNWSLLDVLSGNGDAPRLQNTDVVQPALAAVQIALAGLLRSWGVVPDAVVGHSVGEIAAAHVAGVLTLEEAMRLACVRGRVMQPARGAGAMAAVALTLAEAQRLVAAHGRKLSIAAVNGPTSVVIAGDADALSRALEQVTQDGRFCKRLECDYAFHSTQMDAAAADLERALGSLRSGACSTRWVSTVTGQPVSGADLDAGYWARGVRETVRFSDAIETLAAEDHRLFVEVGPHPALVADIEMCLRHRQVTATVLPTLRRGHGRDALAETLAAIYQSGRTINWAAVYPQKGRVVALPAYAWQRERYWLEPQSHRVTTSGPAADGVSSSVSGEPPGGGTPHPLLGRRLPSLAPLAGTVCWERSITRDGPASWIEYTPGGTAVLSAGAFLDLAAAALEAVDRKSFNVTNFDRSSLVTLAADTPSRLQVVLAREGGSQYKVQFYSRPGAAATEAAWDLRATATVRVVSDRSRAARPQGPPLDFGLMFFASSDDALHGSKYRLVLEAAKYGDREGFHSVMAPERHFSKFGSLYPNPAVLHAAVARETSRIRLRAGSVVLPLHNAIRVAEEWSVVDNLSNGRVEVSFAAGWHPRDFVFFPDRYPTRHDSMFRAIETVRKLWRGEAVSERSGTGDAVEVRIYPTPVQPVLPIWVTAADNPETFAKAGAIGANLLTHLLDQEISTLADRIRLYRESRANAGFDPMTGRVAVMLHTYLGDDVDKTREEVRAPYCAYLKSIAPQMLSALGRSRGRAIDATTLSESELDAATNFLFERLYSKRALLGTPESCADLIAQLVDVGVDEAACLLDFGAPPDAILHHLEHLDRLRRRHTRQAADETPAAERGDSPAVIQARCPNESDLAQWAHACGFNAAGLHVRVASGNEEALVCVRSSKSSPDTPSIASPADLLSYARLVLLAAANGGVGQTFGAQCEYLPLALGEFRSSRELASHAKLWAHARTRPLVPHDSEGIVGDVRVVDESGSVVAEMRGLHLRPSRDMIPEAADASVQDLLYDVEWSVAEPSSSGRTSLHIDRWLVVGDGDGDVIGRALAEHWTSKGVPATLLAINDPTDVRSTDFGEPLIRAASGAASGQQIGVVFLGALEVPSLSGVAPPAQRDETFGVGPAVQLLQVLSEWPRSPKPRVWMITRGVHNVDGRTSPIAIEQSVFWGLGRAAAAEMAECWGGLIDVDPDLAAVEAALRIAATIGGGGDETLVYRDAEYVPRFRRRRLSGPRVGRQVSADASYLITGGLGALGLATAQWLIDAGARHLVLLGRTGANDDTGRAALAQLSNAGARVTAAAVDVANGDQLSALLEQLRGQNAPPIRGVIHAAGVVLGSTLAQLSRSAIAHVLRPKVAGGWNLHRAFADAPLDFFVLYSAIPSMLGWLGQGAAHYAAANAFLDSLAHYRRSCGQPAQSIVWGPWADIGMAARSTRGLERLGAVGVSGLKPEQARTAFNRILWDSAVQVAVLNVDWSRFLKFASTVRMPPMLSEFAAAHANQSRSDTLDAGRLRTQLASLSRAEGERFLCDYFTQRLADALKLPASEIEPGQPLTSLGFDSLMAIEVKTAIEMQLGVSVPLVTLLQGASIAHVVAGVMQKLQTESDNGGGFHEPGEASELSQESDPLAVPSALVNTLSDADVDRMLAERFAARQNHR